MSAVRKHRQPANDQTAYAKMPFAALPRSYWTRKKTGILALLTGFAILLGFAIASSNVQTTPAEKQPPAPRITAAPPAEPYDIKINASELAPPANENKLIAAADKIPITAISPQANGRQHPLPPVLEITVDEDDKHPAPEQNQAAYKASAAKTFARQGDLQQALRLQHRATELAPDNMLYRLDLAILYDRLGEKTGAITLYQQVIQAHEAKDATLPSTLAIEEIRTRVAYLTGS